MTSPAPLNPANAQPNAFLANYASSDLSIAWFLAAVAVLLQTLSNGRYGYFRDELYFLACSDHLAWGYVDFAPLVALLARVSRFALGDSLHAIRFLPALAEGGQILITGLIAREMGGKRFAIFLSCLSVLLAPVILGNATRFSMNPFEPLFWMGSVYFLVRRAVGLADLSPQPYLAIYAPFPHARSAPQRAQDSQEHRTSAAPFSPAADHDAAARQRRSLDTRPWLFALRQQSKKISLAWHHLSPLSRDDDEAPRQGLLSRSHLPHALRRRRSVLGNGDRRAHKNALAQSGPACGGSCARRNRGSLEYSD